MFASEPQWLEELNPDQRGAVTHPGGPLLVVAGAGSGKTKTLACRVAYLIEKGILPERLLLLTFTRRAAREMLQRSGSLVSTTTGRVWGGTFHSVANRLLRIYGEAIGIAPTFTVMDQSDSADLLDMMRSELGLGRGERRFPRKDTLAAIYSRTVNAQTPLPDIVERYFPWCNQEVDALRDIFRAYAARKRRQQTLDYDDLLLYWDALLRTERIGDVIGGLFDHVLVDEYQDTNAAQSQILRNLRRNNDNVMVVGDDAQAIYSFRSATIDNILEFPDHFPGTTIVTLEQNYRSTPPILDVSNRVIALAARRYEKQLWSDRAGDRKPGLFTCFDEAQQSDEVCRRVLEHRDQGVSLMRQAVLFRAGHHSAALEIELSRRNIPFVKYGGLKFLEAAHVKDLVAMLKVLENPFDELAWFRTLQLIDGIGPASARRLMERIGIQSPEDGVSPLARFLDAAPAASSPAALGLEELRAALRDCATGAVERAPAAQIERLAIFYEPVLQRRYDSFPARANDVKQIAQIASAYGSRSAFITDITLDAPNSTGDFAGRPTIDEDYLILSTIHSAKGCEWDVVHVIHASDGMIPSDMAVAEDDEIEEERRLFYVALTRAKDALYVYRPLRYYHRRMGFAADHSYAQRTRFITDDIAERFDQVAVVPEESSPAPTGDGGTPGSVDALLGRLWGTD